MSKFKLDESRQIQQLEREVKILLNAVEPDPEYQPKFIGDSATFFDFVGHSEQEIRSALSRYFDQPFQEDLALPLADLVARIKQLFPGWPEDENWRNNGAV